MYYEMISWQNYVADGIKILTGNTSGDEKYKITARFKDLLTKKEPSKEQTAEEIIENLRRAFEG